MRTAGPSGALLANLRAGDGFVFGLVRDALIFVDRGPFREALAAIDDESLELCPRESMDKPGRLATTRTSARPRRPSFSSSNGESVSSPPDTTASQK
jgi:hypothetical protein